MATAIFMGLAMIAYAIDNDSVIVRSINTFYIVFTMCIVYDALTIILKIIGSWK